MPLSEQHLYSTHQGKQNQCLLESLPRFFPLTCPFSPLNMLFPVMVMWKIPKCAHIPLKVHCSTAPASTAELQHFCSRLYRELSLELFPWRLNKKSGIVELRQSTLKGVTCVSLQIELKLQETLWGSHSDELPDGFPKKKQDSVYRELNECFSWRGTISTVQEHCIHYRTESSKLNFSIRKRLLVSICLQAVCQCFHDEVAGWFRDKLYRVSYISLFLQWTK